MVGSLEPTQHRVTESRVSGLRPDDADEVRGVPDDVHRDLLHVYPALSGLTLFNTGSRYQLVSGWADALDGCTDMAAGQCGYLKERLALLTSDPEAYVTTRGTLRTRRLQWL